MFNNDCNYGDIVGDDHNGDKNSNYNDIESENGDIDIDNIWRSNKVTPPQNEKQKDSISISKISDWLLRGFFFSMTIAVTNKHTVKSLI